MNKEGIIFVISAPSGAGKTSLCKELLDYFPHLRHSVSYTTRPARAGEVHGRDYFFVAREEFLRMVAEGEFAEWAEVHGNLYGTSVRTLQESREAGIDLILDIDCQGARQLKQTFDGAAYIFILPPDVTELRRRLVSRNTDAPEVIERRLTAAAWEINESSWYDYIIINDDFAVALAELKGVFLAEHCRASRVQKSVQSIFPPASE